MSTTLHFRGGDLAGTYNLSDPTTPADVTTFWSATGGQVGETSQGYMLAGLFPTGVDEQRGEVLPVESSLAQTILLGDRPALTSPLRCRMMGGPLL